MYVIGLTGEIAVGKSSAARMLANRGAVVIDGDQLVHELYAGHQALLADIIERFGPDVLAPDSSLDRAALGRTVFPDPAALADLERLVHPHVRAAQEELLAKARREDRVLAVLDAVKLVESGAGTLVDELWIVTAPSAAQQRRLQARGLDDAAIASRLAVQQPWEEKARLFLRELPARPIVLLANGGTLRELRAQVDRLWPALS
ncbi:MAG: dephospho-CoA kinase [Dehalococcoidia bacterium]|nr:dephospho-CoA kinase [Dehalococcoidia bacterium]